MVKQITEFLIVEVTDCRKLQELEVLHYRFGCANFRAGVGLVLIGLPGIEKRLASYRPLGEAELRFVVAHEWTELGLTFAPITPTPRRWRPSPV